MTWGEWFLVFSLAGQPHAVGPFNFERRCQEARAAALAQRPDWLREDEALAGFEWHLPTSARCEQRRGEANMPQAAAGQEPNRGAEP